MAKQSNNPNGKKGGDKHQELQKELLKKLKLEINDSNPDSSIIVAEETVIPTHGGIKSYRIADLAAYISQTVGNTLGLSWFRVIQIGKTKKNGEPVKREIEAIKDIEKATGVKVEFYDYNTKKKIR